MNTGVIITSAIIIGFLIIRQLWKVYTYPSAVLGRQAANMNWVAAGSVKDFDGYNNVRYVRDNMEAVVSFNNCNVILTKPSHKKPFKDFIEVEQYLATKDKYAELPEEFKSRATELANKLVELQSKTKVEVEAPKTVKKVSMKVFEDSLRNKWISFNQEQHLKEDIPLDTTIQYFITPARKLVVSAFPEFCSLPDHMILTMALPVVLKSGTHSKEKVNAAIYKLKKKYPLLLIR